MLEGQWKFVIKVSVKVDTFSNMWNSISTRRPQLPQSATELKVKLKYFKSPKGDFF